VVCIELVRDGRYGLEERRERIAVDTAWKVRLRQDPEQYSAWEEIYQRCLVYWTRRGWPSR